MANGSVILRRSFLTFGAQIVVAACSVFNNFLIARALGPEGKGTTYLIVLLCGVIVYVFMGGLDQAEIYYVARKLFLPQRILGTATTLGLVACGMAIGLFFAAPAPWILAITRGLSGPLRGIALAGVTPLFVAVLWTYFSLGLNRIRLYNFLRSMPTMSYTLLLIAVYILFPHRVMVFVLAWLISIILTCILAFVLVNRLVKIRPVLDMEFAKKGVAFGLKTHLGTILQFFNYRFDALLVNYWWGGAQLGLYSVAVAVAEILWYIPQSASTLLSTEVPRRDTASANQLTSWACRNVLWITAGSAILLYFMARPLITYLLPAFVPALSALGLLLPGVVAICITRVITSDLNGRGKPLVATYIAAATAVLGVVLYFWLIPKYGMEGAALASSIIYGFSAVLSLVFFMAQTRVGLSQLLIPRWSDLHRYVELYGDLRGRLTRKGEA
jgi:O-antigen/teichoic acid export membrane protein